MSKTLRRPMFRGGSVNSRGTGITSGLDDSGYADGGQIGGGTIAGDLMTDGRYGFQNPTFISPISTSRTFGVEPGYNLLDKLKSIMPDTRSIRQRREAEIDRIRSGIDTSGASVEGAIEFGNTGFGKDTTTPPPSTTITNIPTELTDEEQLIKQTQLYQKLLGGDEAKSQAVYDALLAASPAFFKGKNLKEAAPEVLTAINKSGAFDKPRDIKQAAAQLAIQRNMLRDKSIAEEKTRLAIYGAKNVETLSETLKNIPGSFIAGPLPKGSETNPNLLRPGGIYSVGNEKFYAVPGDVVDSSGKKKPGVVGLQKL
jgi:hypothetical protein